MLPNSLGPSDATWRQRTESTLAQVMACCLTAPSHYLNQCWLIISKFLWHPSEGITLRKSEETNQLNKIENYIFKIVSRSPGGQWVNNGVACPLHRLLHKTSWQTDIKETVTDITVFIILIQCNFHLYINLMTWQVFDWYNGKLLWKKKMFDFGKKKKFLILENWKKLCSRLFKIWFFYALSFVVFVPCSLLACGNWKDFSGNNTFWNDLMNSILLLKSHKNQIKKIQSKK